MNANFANVGCHPITDVLSRLERVKKAGGSFLACCPAHDDRHPSLRIVETNAQVVLLRCWVGCSAREIVNAIGLELRNLFPATPKHSRGKSAKQKRLISGEIVEHAQLVAQIGRNWEQQGITLAERDQKVLIHARIIVNGYGAGDGGWMYPPQSEPETDQVEQDGDFDGF